MNRLLKILPFLVFCHPVVGQIPITIGEKDKTIDLYGDLVITPMMTYTISSRGSNIPTSLLIANGIKANLGFELGGLMKIYTTRNDGLGFLSVGASFHFLGFKYGQKIIDLDGSTISNHRHTRFFIGLKFIPFEKARFFSLNASAGYGNISANYSSKNINGKLKARTGDVSFSVALGLNRFIKNE